MKTEPAFELFGAAHIAVIVLTLAVPIALALAFHCTKSMSLDRAVRIVLSTLLVADYVGYVVYQWLRGPLQWAEMLPCQLCDWTMFAIVVALITGGRERWLEVAYFWGIGGSLQAIITPNLQVGFPDIHFFVFFLDHGGIVTGILYLMLSRRFRPTIGSVWRTLFWSEIYLVVALLVDQVTDVNYGFLLHKPQVASLLSLLSDWRPLYILQINGVAILFFALLYAPFAVVDLVRKWGKSPTCLV
jgi:hypothetical integral membrane protein (TIGR02206 family)